MTRDDHIVVMKDEREKTVKVAELKAGLSAYLRAVRKGHAVTVCDRETPIARLVPYQPAGEPLPVREPTRALHDVALPPPLGGNVDSLAALLEERQVSR
jgi:prevent-host-death family protein